MDAEPSTSVDDPPPNHERSQLLPSLAVDNGSLRIKPPAQPRSLSRQSQNSDETTFWDSQTTAAQSPPFSPYAEPPSSASRALSESSFTTATPQLSQDNSPAEIPDVGVTSPTPVPTRLESERQRWLLSRGGRADSFPPSTPTSLHNSRDGPASEPGSTTDKRGPASRSSHGIETSSGPPPALLNRKSQTKDSIRRSPTSRIVSQRGLQPLRLVSQRGGPLNRQRSDTTVRPNNAQPSSDLKSPTSASSPADGLLSPRSLSLARSMDGRPTSSGRLMRRTAPAEYFEGIGAISGEDESPGNVESGTEGQSSEDVFLNLAQDTPQKDSGVGLERRRSRRSAAGQRQSLPLSSSISRADSSERDSVYGPPSAYGNSRLYSRRPSQIATSGLGSYRDSSPVLSAGGRVDSVSRLDAYRSRYYTQKAAQPVPPGPKSPDYPTYGRRRPSITEDHISPPHRALHSAYRPSKLNNAYADLDSSPNADTPPEHGRKRALSRADAESVGSGHAPSAMYDELEDLKSRIRRIEILGKSPSAAGVGVQSSTSGSNERPRTATTTVTTISSSPKHNKLNRKSATSPPTTNDIAEHEAEGSASSNLHPLLHEALVRCKIVLKPGLYRIVDAAATEALEMASLTSSAGPQGTIFTAASIINGATVSDRQIRRKADNMCRTLTELCIALCENQGVSAGTRSTTEPNSPAVIQSIETRPGSKHGTPQADVTARDESPASETLPYQGYAGRSASLEPESVALQRSSPSRALSRIEARRTSLNVLGLGSASATNSPREARPPQQIDEDSPLAESDFPSQQQRISGVPSRFSRAGTSLLRARRRPNDEVDDDDPTLRPLSRAMTDAGARPNQLRIPTANTDKKRAHRLSREYVYTSDEPLPGQVPLRLSTAQLSGNGLRRVTSIQSQQSPLLRDNASIVGSADRRFYFDRPGPSTPFEGGERQRIPSMGTTYSSSRRNSAGLSLSRQLRGSTPKSVAVDGGAE